MVRLCEKVLGEWGETLKSNLHDEFSELNEYGDFIDINKKWLESIINGRSFVDLAIPPYKLDYEPLRGEVKKERILIAGFLQRCDHFASWCEKEGESLDRVEIEPKAEDEIENKIAGKIGHDAWQFGTLANNKDKNVILVAPTGYGKTEFAFLWSRGEKLLYTLPIRSAVNQTYEGRAKEVFGEGKAGLLHSDADVYLLSQETDEAGTMKLYDLAKQLSYPVMISTGDQFFPYALRPPGYEKVFALLSYSRLVIDEIQAYDPKACAIVTKFMEWMHKMGGKFLLMTATLPKFVENRIKESAPDCEMINIYENEKDKFQKIFKHKLEVELIKNKKGEKTPIFELPEDKIEKIIREAESGKRVLVILNTVNFAQEVYRKLVEKACSSSLENNIFLLHSRFTLEDRRNKETEYIEKFKNPKPPTENIGEILVATQVVEASLDIDADVLFTEICPLDALIQRMGRVLRRYFYRDGKVTNKSDNLEYDISQEEFRAFSNEPNVYVWVFVKGLQSGRGKVYSEELIKLSLAWLWKKKEIEDIEPLLSKIGQRDGTDEVQVEDFFREEFSPLLGSDKKTEKSKETYYKKLLNGNWLENVDKREVELSEYDKYALVALFYSS
ncbi:CRISPR-associated helicase Cas3', partial [Candidatus Sordicultor fermentans]|uniref:CRISPR-associated helicase Cas3' n=1 Tax=Candidatus Sordicultor fermentans TaxID=1953203 RepID=UPI0039088F6C